MPKVYFIRLSFPPVKDQVIQLFEQAVAALRAAAELPAESGAVPLKVERSRGEGHGDYATGVALALARTARCKPAELAAKIVERLPPCDWIERVEIAGPGFINVFLKAAAQWRLVDEIRRQGAAYGHGRSGHGEKVMVEFVSTNPTGPLHVGHGRGAACGDALVRILRASGYDVFSEYYINDSGRQMNILALSVWLRYLELCGASPVFPDNGYRGEYVTAIARDLHTAAGERYRRDCSALFTDLPAAPEEALDALIERARTLLGDAAGGEVFDAGLHAMLDDIRGDLEEFRVTFDNWFSESSLMNGALQEALDSLREKGHLYERDGALWFRSGAFGDTKDRVVRRANGEPTYFASDIAYHLDKVRRGYRRMINVLGADHHGYVARVRGALDAADCGVQSLEVLFVQLVALYRNKLKVSMSTRQGEFVTLRELRNEVGVDAARFFYVMRRTSQQLDFDMDLARSRSNDNPVYYVQYAHARVCSVFAKWRDAEGDADPFAGADYSLLREPCESDLLATLARFPEVVASAASEYEPHQVAYYLREAANHFHAWYNQCRFIEVEPPLRAARLALADAARRVIANGLELLGVAAPERM